MSERRSKPQSSNSSSQQEIDKVEKQFEAYENNVKELTLDRMNAAPKQEIEQQTRLSQSDMNRTKEIYLKPKRTIGPGANPKTGEREKFNEKFRSQYEFAKEYVCFTAENNELIGESIDLWTKPFPGMNLEEWEVPANKPVWGPRYLAEQIKNCKYHRLKMAQTTTATDQNGQYYGALAVDTTVQRLDAHPATNNRSVFMGKSGF